jgi:hypothetical protein
MMVYSAYLSEALAQAGAQVAGVALGRPKTPLPAGLAVKWESVPGARGGRLKGLLSALPFTAFSHGTAAVREAVQRLLTQDSWDVVVVDHLQSGWVLEELAKLGPTRPKPSVVYVSHNYETDVRAQVAARESRFSLRRLVLALDSLKIARLERRLIAAADLVTAITDADAATFRGAGAKSVVTLTPGWTGATLAERTITADLPRRAVVLGHWEWHVK